MEPWLLKLTDKIQKKFSPVSIFLYGSHVQNTFIRNGDYVIGVFYAQDSHVSRKALKAVNPHPNVSAYAFCYEDFLEYRIDSPFPEKIYIRDLILGGKTLAGKDVLGTTPPPPIFTIDLLQGINFCLGNAVSAVVAFRNVDMETAAKEFVRSSMYGTRCLIALLQGKYPFSHAENIELSTRLDTRGFQETLFHAFDVRQGAPLQEDHLYRNIAFLSRVVRDQILADYTLRGNIVLVA